MVDLVGNGATQRPPDKVCPLAWAPIQQQGPAGLQLPNAGVGFIAGNCVKDRCGWWSESHERCSIVSLAGLQSHELELADQASVAVTRMRPTVDELEDAGFEVTPPAHAHDPAYKPPPFDEMLAAMGGVRADAKTRDEQAVAARVRIADELRRLRHVVVGVYALASHLLPGMTGTARGLEATGRQQTGDDRKEDKAGGENPGEPG
jgi:hypothetical protein